MPHAHAARVPADEAFRLSVPVEARPSLVALLGTGLFALANAIPYYPGNSVDHLLTHGGSRWEYASLFALPLLAGVGSLLAALRETRSFGGGLLLATGAAGYLVELPRLSQYVIVLPGAFTPRAGMLVSLLAATVVLGAGMLALAGGAAAAQRPGRLLTLRIGICAGGFLLLGGALIPWANTPGGLVALLYRPGVGRVVEAQRWYALPAVALGLAAIGTAIGLGEIGRRAAAGMLVGAGAVAALFFVPYSLELPSGIALRPGGYVGLAGGVLLAASGAAALLVGRATTTVERDAADVRPGTLARTAATRYLCAAAHLDDRFARQAIRRVVDEEYRAVAPSFGVDLGTVLRHCFAARRRKRMRDVLLTALAVPAALLLVERHTAAGVGYLLLILALAWAVVFGETWISRYRIGARRLSRHAYDPLDAPGVTEVEAAKIAALESAERGNVTIYSGFRPFVGSGWDHGGWSFALNVGKGKKASFGNGERRPPRPFAADELYATVVDDVRQLDLDDVTVEDRLYVDGQGIRDDQRFVPHRFARPRAAIDPAQLDALVHAPELTNRVYRCIRVNGWDGEFVLSIFLNFACVGRSLFAEARYFVLAPFRDEYLMVDKLEPRPTLVSRGKAAATALARTGLLLPLAAPRLLGELRAGFRAWRSRWLTRRMIRSDPSFDYGATTSVRELAQSSGYRRYFQQLDREMIGKVLERQILDSIVRFLDEHDIDTSELEERQTAILNNGVIVSGGTLKAESLAVGSGARARVSRVGRAMKQPKNESAAAT